MLVFRSPQKHIQNPDSKTFGVAILLTDLLLAFVLWVLSGRFSPGLLISLLAILVLTIGLSIWMIIRGIFLDPTMLHAFVILSGPDSLDFQSRKSNSDCFEAQTGEEKLLYITMAIPEREVRFSQFPNNLGFDAIRDISQSGSNNPESTANRIKYFSSSKLLRDVETLLFEGRSEVSTEKGLTLHNVDEVVSIESRYYGLEFKYRNSDDHVVRRGFLYKHLHGYDKIQNCLIRKLPRSGD